MRSLVIAAWLATGALAVPAGAQEVEVVSREGRGTMLSVSAVGTTTANPDLATIGTGVSTYAATAQAATAENAERMTTLLAALRRAGVEGGDIQTSWVRVDPRYNNDRNGNEEPRIVGYQATNMVRANIRAIDRVGAIVDAVVAAGGNQIGGISFGFQDREAQLNLARRDAVRVARERAQLYADAFGMRVVSVVSAQEAGAPQFGDQIVVTGSRIRGNTPIEIGELETSAPMTVTFELR